MASSKPTPETMSASRFGRHGPRSKTGCTTCRTRKVKCDETRDICNRCAKAQIHCEWDQPVRNRRPTKPSSGKSSNASAVPSSPANLPPPAGDISSPPLSTTWTRSVMSDVSYDSPTYHTANIASGSGPDITSPASISSSQGLLLSPEDLESFDYIPRSFMVLRFGKPWRWSMLCYVHTNIARRETGVMRAFIAVASLELRSRELVKSQDLSLSPESHKKAQSFKVNASNSLHLAMQDLSSILDRVVLDPNDAELLETLFSMWFLILHFGIYDSDLVEASYMHLNGVRSFLAQSFHGDVNRRIHVLPPACKQLLVYICYLDIMLALGSMNGGQLSLYLMSVPADSPVFFNTIFEEARVCVAQLWGSAYPVEELLDDVENYRPLKFLNETQILKLQVWELGISSRRNRIDVEDMRHIWSRIDRLGEAFYDLLLLSKQTLDTGGRRVIWTVYHACLDYFALKILYSCIDEPDTVPSWLENSITDLLGIAHKAINEDSEHVYRYAWALHMALFKVRDPIHRDWLQTQIRKASLLLSNLGIPSRPPDNVSVRDALFVEPATFGDMGSCSPSLV